MNPFVILMEAGNHCKNILSIWDHMHHALTEEKRKCLSENLGVYFFLHCYPKLSVRKNFSFEPFGLLFYTKEGDYTSIISLILFSMLMYKSDFVWL